MSAPAGSGGAPGAAPVKVFVAERGNRFMTDIAAMICEAAGRRRTARLITDELPRVDGSINLVVAPHEFFELMAADRHDLQAAAAASVCVGTEQPGTPWFRLTADACRRGLLTLDINELAVAALRAEGIDTRRLRLGATPSLDLVARGGTLDGARRLDVLFMGGLDDRRGRLLAELAPALHPLHCDLRLFRFDRPIGPSTPGVVFGHDKYDLLADARVLLNLHRLTPHRDDPPGAPPAAGRYFEWVRMIEAMANGCAVVSEPSVGFEPLVPGEHFVVAAGDGMADAVTGLLADETRRLAMATAAHRVVTAELTLADALEPHLADIEARVLPRLARHVASRRHRRGRWGFHGEVGNPVRRLGPFRPYAAIQRSAKALALAENAELRRLDGLRCLLAHGDRRHVTTERTPSHERCEPDLSVVVTLYDYGDVVAETLDSIAASTGVDLEIVVVEDHANDDSRAVVRRYMAARPQVPLLLLAKDCNEGLAAARNDGFAVARAPYVMVMDADNHVYPECLARLRQTLVDHPGAAAAYAVLEDFGDQRNVRSALDWDVERLCAANYIDAQAMWRLADWQDLGGYRDADDHVYGWEDWDLWLRLAERGGHAVLRREILGRYRVRHGSMISLTNLAVDEALADARARHPSLPWQDAMAFPGHAGRG